MCSDFYNLTGSCYIQNWPLIMEAVIRVLVMGVFVGALVGIVSNLTQKGKV